MGEGFFGNRVDPSRDSSYRDIAESINAANLNLANKIKSIAANAGRLSAVEEELSSRFRPKGSVDGHVRNLVYQLKICTSRLKNDLNEFSLSDKKPPAQ